MQDRRISSGSNHLPGGIDLHYNNPAMETEYLPTYRVDETYERNYAAGPAFSGPFPSVPATPSKLFLGLPVRSRLGVSAGLLLNAKWVECYARLGFDLLTYKTVRSSHRPCYPLPNWVRVDLSRGLPNDPDEPVYTIDPPVVRGDDVSWSVCFGMPSMAPEVWRQDIRDAKSHLREGQLLLVSVVGTPPAEGSLQDLADDFARCAAWARESGADIVEANFSCPNVCSAEGQIYQDIHAASLVSERMRQAIGRCPLLIKTGNFGQNEQVRPFLHAVAESADGVVLVNGIQRRVLRPDGTPAFGPHERAGILGRAIHADGVRLVADAVDWIRKDSLPLVVAGVGGVFNANDAADFFNAGAEAVFLGGSPMVRPTIAIEMKCSRPDF
ncbi:MAG: hypothetical protein U1D30_23490 [Planctomycetota bacterium]